MLRAVLIGSVALASACDVGEVDIGGGTTVDAPVTNMAKAMAFETNVKPVVMARGCVAGPGGACHAVQIPVLDTYAGLTARYTMGPSAMNIMITKGEHQGQPYFTPAELSTVAAWIDMP